MKLKFKKVIELFWWLFLFASVNVTILSLFVILYFIIKNGINKISFEFLFSAPKKGMLEGGIFPQLFGTFLVTLISGLVSVPLGIGCAIYLNEYSKENILTRIIRIAIRNLSGVPSIVFGLFGFLLFVQIFNFGMSLISAGLTLGIMTLPIIISVSEEALKGVPIYYREIAYSFGATKWQAIKTAVLPYALPGILTGIIIGLSRAAGETAPILFTGVAFYLPYLPKSIFSQFMALPYHLYIMSTQHHSLSKARPVAYGTALVLLILVLMLNLYAIILRYKKRKIKLE
jgi:phosphate transport system permease protein